MRPLYFGCLHEAGHYVWGTDLTIRRYCDDADPQVRFLYLNDGRLAPHTDGGQSEARLTQYDGFAVLAMWDYTVDRRPGSNAMFLLPGVVTAEQAVTVSRSHFPSVVARIESAAPISIRT